MFVDYIFFFHKFPLMYFQQNLVGSIQRWKTLPKTLFISNENEGTLKGTYYSSK